MKNPALPIVGGLAIAFFVATLVDLATNRRKWRAIVRARGGETEQEAWRVGPRFHAARSRRCPAGPLEHARHCVPAKTTPPTKYRRCAFEEIAGWAWCPAGGLLELALETTAGRDYAWKVADPWTGIYRDFVEAISVADRRAPKQRGEWRRAFSQD